MTSRFSKPCLKCGKLSKETYCPIHNAEVKQSRQAARDTVDRRAKKSLMYNSDYRKRRQALLEVATHCHLCKKPFIAGDRVEADHLTPGDPNSALAPAHRLCNQRRGDKPLT